MPTTQQNKDTLAVSVTDAYDRVVEQTIVDSVSHLYFGGFYCNPLESLSVSEDAIQASAGAPLQFTMGASSGKYAGGILHSNAKVYAIPFNATQVLEYDPITRTATLFGSLSGTSKFMGGALASTGKFMVAPFDSLVAAEIDPVTKTIVTFGNFAGLGKWSGIVAGTNGSVYAIPYNDNRVLRIVGSTRATSFIAVSGVTGNAKWRGGVFSPKNSLIIGVPHSNNRLLLINPTAGTATLGVVLAPEGVTFSGAVCGPDGNIYFIPDNATTIYVYDPLTTLVTTFGVLPEGEGKWKGGTLAPNGKIYCMPHNYDAILEIDTYNLAVRRIGKFPGTQKWMGSVLTTLGNVVGIPFDDEGIISVLGTGMSGTNWWALNAHANVF